VNITGGTVAASSATASAIGGGLNGKAGKISISGTADVTLTSSNNGVWVLYCDEATATPDDGYTVFVQDKEEKNLDGTPSTEKVDLKELTDSLQYAHIFFDTDHIVVYNANGGKGTMDTVRVEAGDTVKISENKFTREGYNFLEWNTAADGTGMAYKESSNTALHSDITLYAQWGGFTYYYTDSTGNAQGLADEQINILTAEIATEGLASGFWLVKDTIVCSKSIKVNTNNVTIILADGAQLKATSGGIRLNDEGVLTITTGNDTEEIAGTGSLIAKGVSRFQTGIGGSNGEACGTVNIYGGTVTATGGVRARGIGAGNGKSQGTLNIRGKADVTVATTSSNTSYTALNCSSATASTYQEGYSVFVQDKNGKNIDGTPSTEKVDLTSIGLTDSLQYAHIFFAKTPKVEVAIGETGWSTLYYGDYNLVIPDGVKAYIVTAADTADCTLMKTEVEGIIPAGTAVLLQGAADTYSFEITGKAATTDVTYNILRGYDVDSLTTADDYGTTEGYYFYKLSRNAAGDNNSVGFYWHDEYGSAFTVTAHKAFMALEKKAAYGKKIFLINDFGDTGINGIRSAENANGKIYDTNGRYYGTDASRLSKGTYIRNGKKFVVK